MIIAIPVDEKNKDTKVCISFGRTPYYLIYNQENKETIFVENAAASAYGGAGIKAAQSLVDQKVDALITYRCGDNANTVLEKAKIKIYKAQDEKAMNNIELLIQNKLEILNEIHPGLHQH